MSDPTVKRPPGRPKGAKGKVPGTVKASVLDAFLRLKGSDGMVAWARQSNANLTEFYKIASRLIPTEVAGVDGGAIVVEVVKQAAVKPED
jgi:hypothetical protein